MEREKRERERERERERLLVFRFGWKSLESSVVYWLMCMNTNVEFGFISHLGLNRLGKIYAPVSFFINNSYKQGLNVCLRE